LLLWYLFTEHSLNSQAGRYAPEDLVTGMQRSGHMSVVRRFFCLFVTFDLLFTVLMWLIIILVSMTLVGLVIFHIWKLIMPYLILQATQESHFVVPFFTRYKHWPECVLAGLANLFLHLTSL